MSHLTVLQVEIDDLATATQALASLGYTVAEGRSITSYYGKTVKPDLAILCAGKPLIGLARTENGKYSLVADWWLVRRDAQISQEQFTRALMQKYSYLKVRKEAEALGFRIISEDVDQQGSIHLQVARWQ